tara:strand:- start:3004 stop:4662 length:1659 start_codon:yes stop_codon:yes gene_type:complete
MLTQLIYTEQMKDYIKKEIIKVLKEIYNLVDAENIVEIQKTSNKHVESDYFTNIAMKLAKTLGEEPNRIAETIVASIDFDKNCKVWVAKPGYINFTLNQSLKNNIVLEIVKSTNLLTSVETKDVKNIIVEFVSANPTGPLHVGHGRGAIYGNIISKYLEIQGHKVHKEYYVNDFGNQINKLVISVFSRIDKSIAQGCSDLYEGSYINDISDKIQEFIKNKGWSITIKSILENNEHSKKLEACRKIIVNSILENIRDSLGKLGIVFDDWFSESKLFERNLVDKTIARLKETGKTIKKDGALMFNDDEPRVLIKSNGEYTYFASDLAYHDKKMREFDRVINIWGADHHGYVNRVCKGLESLGHDIDKLDIHLIQFANLYRGKEKVSMSTRKGEFVELDTLLQEIGIDAINYFYLMRSKDQHLDFDLEVAVSSNKNNPVYYIQYAHARIEKILSQVSNYREFEFDHKNLTNKHEGDLVDQLANFSDICKKSIINLKPQIMTNYLYDLSQLFHGYYASERIIKDKINYSQVYLLAAIQKVVKCGLETINIQAPKEM